ncbi:hypothetical protein MKW94_000335 [Papaver nudicaule]|uniref:Uncharacterized protein n=1 Tax=Papaver nudicaule TaxID=74823 RepID=A0AA41V2H3_PAPNU|nr:hypothetical protein [Papaver nudicaule]
MANDLSEELRRLHNAVTRLSAKIGDTSKKLEESSTSLSRMTEERDHLNQAYNEEKRKMKKIMYVNERLMRELETQRKEIEQQAKEIEKLDYQLDFQSKQFLVLSKLNNAAQVSRKLNTVKGKPKGVKNVSSWGNAQVQIATNALHKELEEKDSGFDNELTGSKSLPTKSTGVIMIFRRSAKFQSR